MKRVNQNDYTNAVYTEMGILSIVKLFIYKILTRSKI